MRRWGRTLVVVASLLALVVGVAERSGAATPLVVPHLTVQLLGPVFSQAEADRAFTVQRDDGLSAPVSGGRVLWVFGDSAVDGPATTNPPHPRAFITGSSALFGPVQPLTAPYHLYELHLGQPLSWSAGPAQFLPTPTDTFLDDGSGQSCTNPPAAYPARWGTGLIPLPGTSSVLETYLLACVYTGTVFPIEGWGYAIIDLAHRVVSSGPNDVVVPSSANPILPRLAQWGSPVLDPDGTIHLYASSCSAYAASRCQAGVVETIALPGGPAGLAAVASATPTPVLAVGGFTPLDNTVKAWPASPHGPRQLLDLEKVSHDGVIRLLVGSNPQGPFTPVGEFQLPGCVAHPNTTDLGFIPPECYAIVAHPEYSSPTRLFVTYYLQDARWKGRALGNHLMAVTVSLKPGVLHPA